MKLTKRERKLHAQAEALLRDIAPGDHEKHHLPDPEDSKPDRWGETQEITAREFIYRYWHPGANHNLGVNGTFFTPVDAARSIACASGATERVLEPTAGIGVIAWALGEWTRWQAQITCVEINPAFVEVGRRLLPEVHWICGEVVTEMLRPGVGLYDSAVGNPPFGRVASLSGVAHATIASLLARHTVSGAILLVPDDFHSQEDRPPEERNPGKPYHQFIQDHPKWRLTPTAWVAPTEFRGCKLKTAIVDLCRKD